MNTAKDALDAFLVLEKLTNPDSTYYINGFDGIILYLYSKAGDGSAPICHVQDVKEDNIMYQCGVRYIFGDFQTGFQYIGKFETLSSRIYSVAKNKCMLEV